MKDDACQRYIEDPEGNPEHLATCEECRALFGARAGADLPPVRFDPDELPLAAWEGASHQSWPAVLAAAIGIGLVALALFLAGGISPESVVRDSLPSSGLVESLLRSAGATVQNAPRAWQIGVVILFVTVNVLLVVLLRRAPKGIDV